MKSIILAGGFATRLRPLTLTRPKPLLPILDRPLLDWIINDVIKAGVKEIIISVRYLSDVVKNFCSNASYAADIAFAEEVRPLGDAGPLKLINELYGLDSTFTVIYGDIFSNIDLGSVIDFHRKNDGIATIVVTEVEDPSKYGVAAVDDDGRVLEFVEKPPRELAPSNLVNAGVYVFEPEVLKYVPDTPAKLAKEVLPKLVKEGVIYAYRHKGIWHDIGVPAEYLKANFTALNYFYPNGYVSNTSSVDEVEIVHPSFISSNVKLGRESVIGPYAFIGRNSIIGNAVRIKSSVLFNNVIIDEGSVIKESLIGERVVIGKWVRIESHSVIGDEVVIKDEVLVPRGTVILPFKEVESSIEGEGRVIL
mgnify:CR=1 FL=1